MSTYRPKITEAFVYSTQTGKPVSLIVIIPEELEAPDALEFLYAGETKPEVRPFVRDYPATVAARHAMLLRGGPDASESE